MTLTHNADTTFTCVVQRAAITRLPGSGLAGVGTAAGFVDYKSHLVATSIAVLTRGPLRNALRRG